MTKTSKTSHLKVKEIKQHQALTYIADKKYPDLNEDERVEGIVELWKNYRALMQDNFWLRGNENDYKGAYLEKFYKNPKWWVGIYDGDKIVGTEYFTFRGLRMFSGFLFADSVEIAKELGTQLYEQAKITHPKLDIVESLHITNVDEYDISFREDIGYRAWSWIDETDKIRELQNVRISFLKKIRSEWEEQNND
jgi:hypothetical protein